MSPESHEIYKLISRADNMYGAPKENTEEDRRRHEQSRKLMARAEARALEQGTTVRAFRTAYMDWRMASDRADMARRRDADRNT